MPSYAVGDVAVHFQLCTVVTILREPSPGRYETVTSQGAHLICWSNELIPLGKAAKINRRLKREIRAARKAA